MFDRLLESRRRRERRTAATTTSVAAHAAIVLLAVVATSRADPAPKPDPLPDDTLIWVAATPAPPEDGWRTGGSAGRAPHRPPAPTELVPGPIDIDIDVDTPVPDERPWFDLGSIIDRHGPPVAGDSSGRGAGTLAPGGVFTRASVERVAALRAGSPTPRYPEPMRAAGLEGRVDMRFVVDTLGRVEPGTSTVLASSDPRFTAAVRDVLPRLRFAPATVGGRRVRMMVEMPFVFRIEGR